MSSPQNGVNKRWLHTYGDLDVRDAHLVDMYQSTEPPLSYKQIGEAFGITRERVRQVLKKYGAVKRLRDTRKMAERNTQKKAKEETKRERRQEQEKRFQGIVQMRTDGATYQQIMDAFGYTSKVGVGRRLKVAGLTKPRPRAPRGPRKPPAHYAERKLKMLAMRAAGVSNRQIAGRLGVSLQVVWLTIGRGPLDLSMTPDAVYQRKRLAKKRAGTAAQQPCEVQQ